PGKSHQSDFGHASFAKAPEQLQLNAVSAAFCTDVSRMSTEPDRIKNKAVILSEFLRVFVPKRVESMP
ncbi:MAG: hypothetical protein WB341_18840, partial [Terracidiphilus sp.]